MLYMDDSIPVNSPTFADEETWYELKLQAPNCAKGNDSEMKQMLKKLQMSSWDVLARLWYIMLAFFEHFSEAKPLSIIRAF